MFKILLLAAIQTHKNFPIVRASDLLSWRRWLEVNHKEHGTIWLELFKKDSQILSINIDDAIDEALCFGWVDSRVNGKDALSYYVLFSPRNPKSNWSRVNKNKMDRLAAEGRLQDAGIKMIKLAKKTGTWDALNNVEDLLIPPDMLAVFKKYPKALDYWNAFPRGVKRGVLEWIFTAKKEETRARRIEKAVSLAAQNKRVFT